MTQLATPRETPRSPKKPPARKKRQKPGRPEGTTHLREDILNAAENIFADLGYAGTTLREIASRAKVTQALISYYFGSKYGLFKEVFLRRGNPIGQARVANLEKLRQGGSEPTLDDIISAFLLPTLALRTTDEGRAFLRLQARLHTEPPEISYALRNEAYNPSTRMYIEALMRAAPHLTEKDAYWRLTLLVGAYLYAFSDTHRLDEIAPGICDTEDSQEIIGQISRFVVAGFDAP